MSDEKILIIGKNEKMTACRNRLSDAGLCAVCADSEAVKNGIIKNYKNIVLPLPTMSGEHISETDITLNDFCGLLSDDCTVFCGNISEKIFPCRAYSYYTDEQFIIKNARLTAQGTLRLILDNVKTDICKMTAAVTGYGYCGKEICRLLKACGFDVTSFSRRSETLAEAEKDGMSTADIKDINRRISEFDITVNTVPFNIISADSLKTLTEKNIYIEIASAPCGVDRAQAEKYDFRYISAGGLPGRFTPVSAGINIAETILTELKE